MKEITVDRYQHNTFERTIKRLAFTCSQRLAPAEGFDHFQARTDGAIFAVINTCRSSLLSTELFVHGSSLRAPGKSYRDCQGIVLRKNE